MLCTLLRDAFRHPGVTKQGDAYLYPKSAQHLFLNKEDILAFLLQLLTPLISPSVACTGSADHRDRGEERTVLSSKAARSHHPVVYIHHQSCCKRASMSFRVRLTSFVAGAAAAAGAAFYLRCELQTASGFLSTQVRPGRGRGVGQG